MATIDPRPERVKIAAMLQSWGDLTFLHWRYPEDLVQTLVPSPLKVETFDGSAWVGVIPFVIRGLTPPLMPSLPWLSHFPETNCRTYVKGPDGHPGGWFFSLDAARAAAVVGARIGYGLPYAWSRMRVVKTETRMVYESSRRWPGCVGQTRIIVEPGAPIDPQPLDVFLTARYRLYSRIFGILTYTNVEHAPWPLHTAVLVDVAQNLTHAAGLPDPSGPPLLHFSPGVRVRVAPPKPVAA